MFDTIKPLPVGCLACLDCGAPVAPDGRIAPIIELATSGPEPEFEFAAHLVRNVPAPFSRCRACRDRLAVAERIAPGARGLPNAFNVLAALGQDVPDKLSAADVGAYLTHLEALGLAIQFADRVVPVIRHGAALDQCAVEPWAHVDEPRRRELRSAVARVMAQRAAAGQVRLTPPEGARGCLYCGVAHVSMDARQVVAHGGVEVVRSRVWRRVVTNTDALGGPGSPGRIVGHLCPACTEAHDAAGRMIGQPGMLRAARAYLSGVGRRDALAALAGQVSNALDDDAPYDLRHFAGWGARLGRMPDAAPNTTPWAHVRFGDENDA